MNIRKIIQEELKKVFSENYPMGAEYHPDAPWNQVDNTREGEKAKQIKYKLIWTDESEFAFLKDAAGNTYVFYIDGIDKDELEPYADREENYLGRDEDGMPDVEYGDWEITGDVIENYVNDNLNSLRVGKGLDDYESAEYELVMLDDELRNDLLTIAPYIKDEKKRAAFLSALSNQVSEGGVTDNIVNKKTMDTPTGTIFKIDLGASE
jgi:hypothetical protein